MDTQIKSALIKAAPQIILIAIIGLFLLLNQDTLAQLMKRISGVGLLGVVSIEIDPSSVPEDDQPTIKDFRLSEALRQRIARSSSRLQSSRALVMRDKMVSARWIANVLRQLGLQVDLSLCSEETSKLLRRHAYDVIVSDIDWEKCPTFNNAIKFLDQEPSRPAGQHVIFFITNMWSPRQVPDYARDVTNNLEEMLHLVLDVLDRKPSAT